MRIRIMFLTALVFAAFPAYLFAQLNAPGAIVVDTTSYNSSTPDDTIFVFPRDEIMTVRYDNDDGANITWYRHNPADNSWENQVATGSQLSVTDDGGYRVEVEDNFGDVIANQRFWIYNNHSLFNAEVEVVFDDCDGIELAGSSESEPLIYYDPDDDTPGRVDYDIFYSWTPDSASHLTDNGSLVKFDVPPFEDVTYAVTVTDKFSNETKASLEYNAIAVKAKFEYEVLKQKPDHELPVGDDKKFSAPTEVQFTSKSLGNAIAQEWSFGDEGSSIAKDPFFVFSKEVDHNIKLKVRNQESGCSDVDSSETIVILGSSLDVPNVFTPNGDGFNDEFRVAYSSIKEFEMVVYNRWGRKVYQNTDPAKGWDGKVGGKTGAPGVYFYYIKAEGYNKGEVHRREGPVHLIRGR